MTKTNEEKIATVISIASVEDAASMLVIMREIEQLGRVDRECSWKFPEYLQQFLEPLYACTGGNRSRLEWFCWYLDDKIEQLRLLGISRRELLQQLSLEAHKKLDMARAIKDVNKNQEAFQLLFEVMPQEAESGE